MRDPLDIEHLARLSGVALSDIEGYRSRGLIDPDGDGLLDEMDILRLRLVMHYRSLGYTIEELEAAIAESSPLVLYADMLWSKPDEMVGVEGIAEEIGLPPDDVEALLRAIGLGMSVPREDVALLTTVRVLVDSGIPLKMIVGLARVYGDTLRRVAQTEVRLIREFLGGSARSGVLKDRAQSERLHTVQELVGPVLEPLLLTIHRRHLLRASVQEAVADLEAVETGADRTTLEATMLFVDLASFTSLASIHGDEVAAEILDRFDELVRRLLDEHNGSLVKQIGDAFMLVFAEPADAVAFAIALSEAASQEPNFPAIRTGIHCGPVLYRVGDYVGTTVNVAARIAELAGAREILMTQDVADAVEGDTAPIVPAGRYEIHGIEEPLDLWRVGGRGDLSQAKGEP